MWFNFTLRGVKHQMHILGDELSAVRHLRQQGATNIRYVKFVFAGNN